MTLVSPSWEWVTRESGLRIFFGKFFPWHYCFFLGICDSQTGGDIWTQFILISYLVVSMVMFGLLLVLTCRGSFTPRLFAGGVIPIWV